MGRPTALIVCLAAAIALGRCRTLFPYIGSGNRFTVRATIPMNFPTNVTFLRVHATSDVSNTSRAIEYAAVASTNRELPFQVTADGAVQLSREVKFRKKKKDRRKYKFNIIAGVPSERKEEKAVLAVELTVTRTPLDCSTVSDADRCWGPWGFLSGLQWFAAADPGSPGSDPGSSGSDPLRLDLRSPLHDVCGAPDYRYSTDRGQTDDGSAAPEPVSNGSAVSVAHLGAAGRSRTLRLIVTCSPGGPARKEESLSEKKVLGVEVLDRNNHAPVVDSADGTMRDVYLCHQHVVKKGDPVMSAKDGATQDARLETAALSAHDKDQHQMSHYAVRVENDPQGLLDVRPGVIDLAYGKDEKHLGSMLYAGLAYKKTAYPYKEFGSGYNYSVQVVFEDKYLHQSYGERALRLTVNLLTSCPPAPPTSAPPPPAVTVPPGTPHNTSLPRNAPRYARVFQFQLPRALIGRPLRLAKSADRSHLAFNVTSRAAILYVSRPGLLRNLSGVVSVTLHVGDESDAAPLLNMTVRVNVTAPVEGCPEKSSADSQLCAAESSEGECTLRCGAGSVGPCRWRQPEDGMTKEYGTCSPDLDTCPDGECDELEGLSPNICPQDCSTGGHSKSMFMEPGSHGRGVKKGRGVCFCPKGKGCLCTPQNHAPRPSDKNLTEEQRARATSATPRSEHTVTHETSVCGTACIIGVSLGVVLLLAMLLLACMIYDSRCGRSSKMRKDPFGGEGISLSHITGDMDLGGRQQMALPPDAQCAISAQLLETVPVDDKWEFPRRRLVLGELLGEGEFGKVLKGKAMGIAGGSGCSQVAVKMLKPFSTPAELQDLLSEYNLLKEVNHPNVIRLLGACTGPGGPVCIIMEFAELGCLRTYLCCSRKSTLAAGGGDGACDITPKELISYSWQISRGMAYLGEMKLVHRDLAARNVLLAEGKVCKISDFGLTRDVYEGSLYQKTSKGRVPVKWMAIESLEDHVYTSKSDVWSFGVLLWELITLGSNPYPGVTPERLCHLLKSGYRMDRPANCTQDMYSIMRQCWQEQPSSRPTFHELSQWFDRMLQSGSEYLDLSTPLVLNREYFDLLSDGDDLGMDRPIDYGNLHLLSSSYLPPRSQPPVDEPRSNQSPRHPPAANQSPLRTNASDPSALMPDLLVYSSLLLHSSDAEDAADGGDRDPPLNYSSLLLPDSEPEEEDSGSGSSDHNTRETCDEQCGLMEVSV